MLFRYSKPWYFSMPNHAVSLRQNTLFLNAKTMLFRSLRQTMLFRCAKPCSLDVPISCCFLALQSRDQCARTASWFPVSRPGSDFLCARQLDLWTERGNLAVLKEMRSLIVFEGCLPWWLHGSNSKHWFTTSFLQPLPVFSHAIGPENCQLTSSFWLVLKQ